MKSEIAAAASRIRGHIRRTPAANFSIGGFDVEIKLEHLQLSGSFKARGAFNNLLSRDVPDAGVVAASGGNHGAAVALAAVRLGHRARIFVPEYAGPVKIGLIQATGAECVVVQGTYAEALECALSYEAQSSAIQLHAYDAPETIAGQGSLFLEWEAQGLKADTVMIAVGGGGLIGGALGWFEGARNVIAVEPELAPTLNSALRTGAPSDVNVGGIAANALGARRIGSIPFGLATQYDAKSVLVTDEAIREAQVILWKELRTLVEPAGAAALAALTSGRYVPEKDEKIAVLLCGANIAEEPFRAS